MALLCNADPFVVNPTSDPRALAGCCLLAPKLLANRVVGQPCILNPVAVITQARDGRGGSHCRVYRGLSAGASDRVTGILPLAPQTHHGKQN